MGPRRAPRVRLLVAAGAVALTASGVQGCGARTIEQPPSSRRALVQTTTPAVADLVLVHPVAVPHVSGRQVGSADLSVHVAQVAGGRIRIVRGPSGGRAFAFPAYVAEGRYPRAVLTLGNRSTRDELDPGSQDFSWGASFKLDASSEGRPEDNGNNLVQRGLFSQSTFFKAELDNDRAACAVRGSGGLVLLHSPYTVPAGVWHRVECDRFGSYLRLRVWDLQTGQLMSTAATRGRIGTLSTPSSHRGIPLSIGGKVAPNGRVLTSASDQFNGDIASPFVRLDGQDG